MKRRRKKQRMTAVPTEATAARIRAEMDLERRLIESSQVREKLARWRRIREHNNIAAAFEASMRGRRT